jgi:hypothetical protein
MIYIISLKPGANMTNVIQFISKPERERTRLIQEARAIYDSIFPQSDPILEQLDRTPADHTIGNTNAHLRERAIVS